MGEAFEAVIGLEVHAQLSTRTKMFCSCENAFGGDPNTRVCPVCLGLPGALPVANARAVELGVAVGLATGCTIEAGSGFARKNYFYPDSPKNYQITQYDRPLCRDGHLDVDGRRVRIGRIHLEEDAGKLIHAGGATLVDLNRAGVPLVEIVTEPDIRSPGEAGTFMRALRDILRYLGASDGNMEEGSLRCDVNVSIRTPDGKRGPATEVKNLNSFRQVEHALHFEVFRQRGLVEVGEPVQRTTLLWNDSRSELTIMRAKEAAGDYRYFPEPDLPPLAVDDEAVARVRQSLPELPRARAARFVDHYHLPAGAAAVLTSSRALADYFESLAASSGDVTAAANWVTKDVLQYLGEAGVDIDGFPVPPGRLADLVRLQADGTINSSTAREVFAEMLRSDTDAEAIVERDGLAQINDPSLLEVAAREVLGAHADEAAAYRGGKTQLLQFFVGQVMKKTGGRANPATASGVLERLLAEDRRG